MSDEHGFTLTRLASLNARLVAHDWAWARDNAGDIARNWERRLAASPELFDGPVLLARGCEIRDGACTVQFFETRFSCFLALRDAGTPDASVANAFSAIVPHTGDGAVLLGQMGVHTANAGQIYFPCGTPDRSDVREAGVVDLAGSAAREFAEETGLALPDAPASWTLIAGEGQLAFLRPVPFDDDAATLQRRIAGHNAREDRPELARTVIARSLADCDAGRMPGFVRAYLASVFGAGEAG